MRVTINPVDDTLNAGPHTVDAPVDATVETTLCLYSVVFNQVDIGKLKVTFGHKTLNMTDKILDVGIQEGATLNISKKSSGCCSLF